MKQLTFIPCINLVLFWVFSTSSIAVPCENLYVVGSNHAAPIAYTIEDSGEPKGVAYDLFREVSVQLKVPVQFLTGVAWSRANAWLDSNEIDVLLGVYDSPQRREKWLLSTPFLQEGTGFYQVDGHLSNVKQFSDLQGFRGGAIRGSSFGKSIDSVMGDLQILQTSSEKELFKMLLSGRLDYVIAAYWDANHILRELEEGHKVSAIKALTQTNAIHLAMNKTGKCARLMEDINAIIADLLQKKQIDVWLQQNLLESTTHNH